MRQKFNPEIWFERQPFNPAHWQPKPAIKKPVAFVPKQNSATKIERDVEVIICRVEAAGIDLTENYEDWLKLGFAFASEFGELGRGYFHRISRFWSGYKMEDCNRQFDKCLKGRRTGVSIKTFFAAARDSGVNIAV